jgi:serine/threonine protein kinase
MSHSRSTAPEEFGPFRVFERLGVGGTSAVFRARRVRPDGSEVEVSLKRLHPHLASNERVVAEFVNEARIAALLEHRNICRFFEVGRLGGEYFIATEYIEGLDLGRLLQRASDRGKPPPLAVAIALLCELCDALDYVHNRADRATGESLEVVHRDISPSNIIVTPTGALKVIDLGIAKAKTSSIQTETGLIKGKLSYLAPEVLAGHAADKLADIFAIGVVAWELLTTLRLFGGATDEAIMERVRAGPSGPPSSANAACPPQLDDIVMRALAPRRGMRWSSASGMKTALQALAATLHEPLEPRVVAAWVRDLTVLGGDTPGDGPNTPTVEATTQILRRSERTQPRQPPRFPTGTGQLPLIAPEDSGDAHSDARGRAATGSSTASVPALPAPGSAGAPPRRILSIALGASVFVNVILVVGLVAAYQPVAGAGADAGAGAGASAGASVDAGADAGASAGARADAGVDAGVAGFVEVDPATVQRVYGKQPRSRSSRARFRVRLCIDSRGAVSSVDVIDGPEHLHRRIARTLSHWRYRPVVVGAEATPVCFDHADRLGAW